MRGNIIAPIVKRRSHCPRKCMLAAVFLAFVAGCGENAPPDLNQQVDEHLTRMKSVRFFAAVLRYHPEAESDIRGRLTEAIKASMSQSPQEGAYGAQVLIATLMSYYVQKDIQKASSAALYAALRQEVDVLQKLKPHPEFCVNYATGKPYFDAPEITPEILKKEGDVAADLVESAYAHPEPLTKTPSSEEIARTLNGISAATKIPLKDISDTYNEGTLSPERRCVVFTEIARVLFQLGPKLGPLTVKQIKYASEL